MPRSQYARDVAYEAVLDRKVEDVLDEGSNANLVVRDVVRVGCAMAAVHVLVTGQDIHHLPRIAQTSWV